MKLSARTFEVKISATAALIAGAAFFLSPLLGWHGAWGLGLRAAVALALGLVVHRHVAALIARPLQTAANMVDAIRQEDFSLRTRTLAPEGALADLLRELNGLSEHLQSARRRATEATALLGAIIERMDVALLAFSDEGVLVTTNPAADRLFQGRGRIGDTAESLGVADWLEGSSERTVAVPGQTGQSGEATMELRRGTFWRGGHRHSFLLVADARRARREHERVAWQRIIRVIGHEVNNTLSPIHSLASTCRMMVRDDAAASAPDLERALAVIEQRADGLRRFITEFARLAKLPPPTFAPVRLQDCVRTAVALEQAATVLLTPGPAVVLEADRAQLEQALVNLIKNAVEAAAQTGGSASVSWTCVDEEVVITIIDDGPGIENPGNLFVPFFSTKPEGSGIGLALSRNIVEAHGGELTLENRRGQRGCIARIVLPLSPPEERDQAESSVEAG